MLLIADNATASDTVSYWLINLSRNWCTGNAMADQSSRVLS